MTTEGPWVPYGVSRWSGKVCLGGNTLEPLGELSISGHLASEGMLHPKRWEPYLTPDMGERIMLGLTAVEVEITQKLWSLSGVVIALMVLAMALIVIFKGAGAFSLNRRGWILGSETA